MGWREQGPRHLLVCMLCPVAVLIDCLRQSTTAAILQTRLGDAQAAFYIMPPISGMAGAAAPSLAGLSATIASVVIKQTRNGRRILQCRTHDLCRVNHTEGEQIAVLFGLCVEAI